MTENLYNKLSSNDFNFSAEEIEYITKNDIQKILNDYEQISSENFSFGDILDENEILKIKNLANEQKNNKIKIVQSNENESIYKNEEKKNISESNLSNDKINKLKELLKYNDNISVKINEITNNAKKRIEELENLKLNF